MALQVETVAWEQLIVDTVAKSPNGEMTHEALVASLIQSGNAPAAQHILNVKRQRRIVPIVESVNGSKPVLRYRKGN